MAGRKERQTEKDRAHKHTLTNRQDRSDGCTKTEKYSGQWVALNGDRLIVSGPTAKEVYSKAKAEGVEIPFVELVQPQSQCRPLEGGFRELNSVLN